MHISINDNLTLSINFFWDVTAFIVAEDDQNFGGTDSFNLQGLKVRYASRWQKAVFATFLLCFAVFLSILLKTPTEILNVIRFTNV
jgi:hypothetical protein